MLQRVLGLGRHSISRGISSRTSILSLATISERSYYTDAAPKPQTATLNTIKDNYGARKPRIRTGRGPSSKRGKTGGWGHKGQKSRAGSLGRVVFEGGQTPLFKRLPKRGFKNPNSRQYEGCNLDKILNFIGHGRLDPTQTITHKTLNDLGLCSNFKHGVKIIRGKQQIPDGMKLNFEVAHASEAAKEMIEESGGSVKYVWFNRVTLRAHLYPEKFTVLPKSTGLPPPRKAERYIPGLIEKGLLPDDFVMPEWDHDRFKRDE